MGGQWGGYGKTPKTSLHKESHHQHGPVTKETRDLTTREKKSEGGKKITEGGGGERKKYGEAKKVVWGSRGVLKMVKKKGKNNLRAGERTGRFRG